MKNNRQSGLRQNQSQRYANLPEEADTGLNLPSGDPIQSLQEILAAALRAGISRPPRSYRQWLEQCVLIPDGKFAGQKFRIDTQPVIGLWVDAIDSGIWNEFVFTAPSQFGKTLIAFIGPLLWHTTEICENYVLGVPFMDMASDKWDLDILPVLNGSPALRALRPKSGSGSAGGKVKDRITLRNGVEIKLMSAGADDTGKAGFTGRVLGVTEAARFSHTTEASVEADPLRQLRARQRQWNDDERTTYIEGTVTVAEELPWALRPQSTDSKVYSPCPHCGDWIAPERDDLIGWDDARNDREARDSAFWACPSCGQEIKDDERADSVRASKLVHRGQTINRQGEISGPLPDTSRLFFRATAYHNLFLSAGSIGKDEWLAKQIPSESPERVAADRQLCQFVHCIPYHDPRFDDDLDLEDRDRLGGGTELPPSIIPADTQWLTAACDVGQRRLWWSVLATVEREGEIFRHVPAYGEVEVPSDRMSLSKAIVYALSEVHDLWQTGFPVEGTSDVRTPDQEWFDAGWKPEAVHAFVRKINAKLNLTAAHKKYTPWVAAYGRGQTTMDKHRYTSPRKTGNVVRDVDPAGLWYLERMVKHKSFGIFWDSDTSKWEFQHALTLDPYGDGREEGPTPGCITLHAGTSKTHQRLRRHWANERLENVITPTGKRRRWKRYGDNHLLDTCAMCWRATERAVHIASKIPYHYQQFAAPAERRAPKPEKPAKADRKDWYAGRE